MKKATKASAPIGLLFGLIFTVAGYFVTFYVGAPILDNAKASESWPKVTGTITKSRVATSRHDGKTMHKAEVTYRYQFEDQDYTGDVVWFGGGYSSSSRSGAAETVRNYPVGEKVDVYVDPADPGNAVLEPGAFFSSYALFAGGLLFLAVGVLVGGASLMKILMVGLSLGYAATRSSGGATGYERYDTGGQEPVDDTFVENL